MDERLMKIIRCPVGQAKLRQEKEALVCEKCGISFPVREGIPVMLIHEATLPEGIESVDELPCQKDKELTTKDTKITK
ncbi:MAG: hypothetical protein GWP14_06310 [Actinobacteria bacterium]|nr:hypothetical protein [Actinomycetota bacterium]